MKRFNFFNKLYLTLSDCDGMCMHCKAELKTRCTEYKNRNK